MVQKISLGSEEGRSTDLSASNPEEETPAETVEESKEARVSKAQKRRERKAEKEKQRLEEIEKQEEENLLGKRNVEQEAVSRILESRGLKLFEIPSDGDCMFAAVGKDERER